MYPVMKEWVIDFTGWAGAVLVLYAYFMVSTRRVAGNSLHYQAANILGAVFLMINTYFHQAYPSTIVNLIWIGIGIYSLLNKKSATL
ncbi:MAG: hypothetical protein NZ522_09455 [Chitinophagales bacterium]|nr:hypothetical protein [Chitinophagales bacterium]